MSVFIGVDGGGTRTRAVVLDGSGAELGRAEGEGRVVTSDAPQRAVEVVISTIRSAADRAGVALPAAALWAGLAGAGQAARARTRVLASLLDAGLAGVVHVGTDAEAAFHDAFGAGPGILLIAGTGSIAWGRGDSGRSVRAGGWGRHLGDEGSGYRIGLAALREVVQAEDGRRPPTGLRAAALERCGVPSPGGLVAWIEEASKAEVAALAPMVAEAAAQGEPAARAIVEQAVSDLEAHALAILERIGPTRERPALALWGGLLAEGGPLREPVRAALAERGLRALETELDPSRGAALLARALI